MNEENQVNSNLTNDTGMAATSLGNVSPETIGINPNGGDNLTGQTLATDSPMPTDPTINNPEPVDSLNPMAAEPLNPDPNVGPVPTAPVTPEANSVMDNGIMGTANPLPNNNLGPIEQPIPGTTYSATSNVNSNGYVETNKTENVGTEPPMQKEPKAKKPMNKILFIILIIALLGAIAYGVWYFLKLGQDDSKISVTTKTVESALNAELSTNIADYATITGTSTTNCQLNTGEVDITKEGAYEYTITCGNDTFKGAIKIVDNTPLTAQTKEVYGVVSQEGVTPKEYQVEEFIVPDTCSSEGCTYAFAEGTDINNYLAQTGNYDVNIVVTDQNGKTNTLTATLIVLANQTRAVLNCSLPITEPTPGTINNYFTFYLNGDDLTYNNYAYRLTTFNFSSKADYDAAVGEKPAELTYNNVTGKATYDDENLTLTLKTILSQDALNSENNGAFPTILPEIQSNYSAQGYTCEGPQFNF